MSNEKPKGPLKNTTPRSGKELPLWTMVIVLVLLMGFILWLGGLPWQADIPLTLFLLLLAIGGTILSRKMHKVQDDFYKNPEMLTARRRIASWAIAVPIVMFLTWAGLGALAYRYSWPDWAGYIACSCVLLIAVSGYIFYRKQSKKMLNEFPYDQKEEVAIHGVKKVYTWLNIFFITLINILLWIVLWDSLRFPWWLLMLFVSLISILVSIYIYKRSKRTNKQRQTDEQDTPVTKSKL
jgi:membrane protein implicated in regulation of membrane protease activity